MNFDIKCENLTNKIIETINSSGLPMTVVLYILGDISNAVRKQREINMRDNKEENTNDTTEETL